MLFYLHFNIGVLVNHW